ncbi:hypothetical protein C8R47DRAFT_1227852 [Mycena vitilis]|nr:hypothetical protein C8R47DRAFT_1227852 [Mycena vitilis]
MKDSTVKGLEGSSLDKPWVLGRGGRLFLTEPATSAPPPKKTSKTHSGPPSAISQATPRWTVPGLKAGGTARRKERVKPLTKEDLWLDDERPPVLAVPKPHHICRMCHDVKSHPVSYLLSLHILHPLRERSYACGHSHCYVCIRIHLESEWSCPQCEAVMYAPPFRHEGEEESLKFDYPWWRDESRCRTVGMV